MIGLGILLIIVGIVLKTHTWIFVLGVVLLVMGGMFWILGRVGQPVGGRRHWY